MDVVPENYTIVLHPDLKKFTFEGTVFISVSCKKPTDMIRMDCAGLQIISCHVLKKKRSIPCKTTLRPESEELQIKLDRKIRGAARIEIMYRGMLNDNLLGFYKSRYRHGKRTKYMATTQFEAADARRAFPCWDQPQAKATFDIGIITDPRMDAISNMPVSFKLKQADTTLHKFERTPVMSTYLVYMAVGEFEYLRGRARDTTIRVVTTPGNSARGRFALNLGKKLLNAYEDYFGIKYPLPKLDLIAIPDFAAGAMENWGAITFRETILLYDARTSSTRTKQFIAEVISHEIAHQWFGNLVTMEWWNDLWLNESFATFMATKFVDMFHPEWDMWSQFIETEMNSAMELDSLLSTHPIDVKVDSPSEIREIFDAISYDKGGCILRMLENFVGESSFKKGLRQYLRDFQYKNATGRDLWNAIGKAAKTPVRAMVESWLGQPGFPMLQAVRKKNTLELSQQRYLQRRGRKEAAGLWQIPLSVRTSKGVQKGRVRGRTGRLRLPGGTAGFVANSGRYGFFRVSYDSSALLDLKVMIDRKEIPATDRWAVQNDLYSMCISGHESIRNYLDFVDAYYNDESYMVSVNVAANLAGLYFRTFGSDSAPRIRPYALNYLRHVLDRIGWDPGSREDHTVPLLRSFVVSALGRMDDPGSISEAGRRFKRFCASRGTLRPDMIEPVCSIAAWSGGQAVHSRLSGMHARAGTAEERNRFLGAMCGFGNARLLRKTLDFSMTDAVRSQDMQIPITRIAANPHGRQILWPWLSTHWQELTIKVGRGNPILNRIVSSLSYTTASEKEIRQFFKSNPAPGTERAQAQVLERIGINRAFLKSITREFSHD